MQKNTYGNKLNHLVPFIRELIKTDADVNVKQLHRTLIVDHGYAGGITAVYDCVRKIKIDLNLMSFEESPQSNNPGKKTSSFLNIIRQFVIENDQKPPNERISINHFHQILKSKHNFTGAYQTLYDQVRKIRSEMGLPGGKIKQFKNNTEFKYLNMIKSWITEDQQLPLRDRRSNAELARKLRKEEGCIQSVNSIMRYARLAKLELGIPTDECQGSRPKDLSAVIKSTPINYSDLKSATLNDLLCNNPKWTKNTSSFKVTKSAITSWINVLNRSDHDIANQDFDNFLETLSLYKRTWLNGKSKSSWPSRESRINLFYRTYLRLQTDFAIPTDFAGRLRYLITIDGRSLYKIGKRVGLSGNQLSRLSNGNYRPHIKNIPKLIELETKVWSLPRGYLTGCIKNPYGLFADVKENDKQTEYASINSQRSQKLRYSFGFINWPAKLKNEWKELKTHFLSHSPKYSRSLESGWNSKNTVRKCLCEFQDFLGFAMLPDYSKDLRMRGLGLKKSQLTLALITDTNIVNEFIEFKRYRTIDTPVNDSLDDCNDIEDDGTNIIDTGFYSTGTKKYLSQFLTYLHPKYGIIKNSTVFHDVINTDKMKWGDWCDHAYKWILDKKSNTKWIQARDPEVPIRYIIEDKDPFSHIEKLLCNVSLPYSFQGSAKRQI